MIKQSGFLLSYIKYRDSDAILHSYTLEKGYQTYFLKGIYSSKNKKKAYLLPLNELVFTLSAQKIAKEITNVYRIEQVENREHHQNIKSNAVIFFIADFLNLTLKNQETEENLYYEIKDFLVQVFSENYQAHYIFLIKILKNFGLLPLFSDQKFLDSEKGVFSNTMSHHLFDEKISDYWKKIISSENPYEIKIDKNHKKTFIESILFYYQLHFPYFKTPKSLEVITQIFE